MQRTDTLIIGASAAGLASAAALQKKGIGFTIIEKAGERAPSWKQRYERLHLHTGKRSSALPYKKFGRAVARYPSRQDVISYLRSYQQEFGIRPVFNMEAAEIRREGADWITHCQAADFLSRNVIIATGAFGRPRPVIIPGVERFPGRVIHSSAYRTGTDYKGQEVLVIGFGNSACEIAIDLWEQGAVPSMSARSAVNVLPRDILGIPVLSLSILLSRLPPRIADMISSPLIRLAIGDIGKLGLRKLPYGPLEQIQKDGSVPVLDIGTLAHIRKSHIKVLGPISHISGGSVCFADGGLRAFGAIVACTGYDECVPLITDRQKYAEKHGLYFCGFGVSPTGQLRKIAGDAKKIANDIAARS